MLKPGEIFSILEETRDHKGVLLAKAVFFESEYNSCKKWI